MLIGLMGYAGSGKDTVANELIARGWERRAFADALRSVALETNPIVTHIDHIRLSEVVSDIGWDRAKREYSEVRKLLQNLGMGVRNHIGYDAWVDAAFKDRDLNRNLVITDVRFLNEAERVKAEGGFLVRVVRPGTEAVNGHVSEHELADYPADMHFLNSEGLWKIPATTDVMLSYLLEQAVDTPE
jgi:hypothetical protein